MFGAKTNKNLPEIDLPVEIMPADFYAGANPVIKYKNVEKEVDLNRGITPAEKRLLDKTLVPGRGEKFHPVNLLSNRKFVIIAASALLILFIAGATWYYWRQAVKTRQAAYIPPAPVIEHTPVSEPVVEPPTTTVEVSTTTVAKTELPAEFPSLLLTNSADLDNDNLTDLEEEQIYQTDASVPDTDGDKYNDGHEVFYLYNPDGTKPMKLIDSGLVKDYSNPTFGYQIYYPAQWALGSVDPEGRQVLFSTLTGENIEARVVDLNGQSFGDWFAANAPGQNYSDLKDFIGSFKETGLMRLDKLVYYFTDNSRLYIISYHTTDSATVNFRATLEMMARSFRLSGNTVAVPLQQTETERLNSTSTEVSETNIVSTSSASSSL